MEEEDYNKLSIEQLCSHKSWKGRLLGFNKVIEILEEIEDEKSSEWTRFSNLLKHFVSDNNVACQEKGLEVVLIFVERSSLAGKFLGELMPEVVQKCLGSPKARIRDLASKVVSLYVEIEKQSAVLDELGRGVQSKNTRVKVACVQVLKEIFMDFGPKVISSDKIIKSFGHLVEDKDQTVRLEARQLMAVIYLWNGEDIKEKFLKVLKSSLIADIEDEYQKIKDNPTVPKRFLRSQQGKTVQFPIASHSIPEASVELENTKDDDVFDSLTPVNILCKLNETFYDKIDSKKWIDRRDALDNLYKLIEESKKLENGDYSELVGVLKKILLKDSNILVVVSAIKCITALSKGLSRDFKQYSNSIMAALFGKFKEKKQNVIGALREAVDSIYMSTSLEALQEDILSFLEEKNPSIKAEVASFLTRGFCKSGSALSNKKLLKSLMKSLCNLLRDQDPNVRENAAEALGTAMKIVGNKALSQTLKEIEEVHLKKINEYCEKAEIVTSTCALPKEILSPMREHSKQSDKIELSPGIKAVHFQAKINSKSKSAKTKPLAQLKYEKRIIIDDEESPKLSPKTTDQPQSHQQQKTDISKVNEYIISDLTNKNWKIRLEAVSKLQTVVNASHGIKVNLGVFESVITERIQDNHHQVSECAIVLLKSMVCAMGQASKRYLSVYLPVLLKAMGDPKARIRTAVIACLNSWSKVCGIDKFFESPLVIESLKNGSPAAQAEIWTWISSNLAASNKSIPEDCLAAFLQPLYSHLECRHAEVRRRATEAAGTFMFHLGYDRMRTSLANMNHSKSSQMSIASVLEKARGNLPLQAEIEEKNKPSLSNEKSTSGKLTETDKIFKETSAGPFMLHESNSKAQRILDQERIKFNCKITKTEQMEELKSIMVNEKINPSLVSDMFDADYRVHLRTIEKLENELPLNSAGLKSNLDLILRWIELRTFDQNSSVVQKDLEYLKKIFEILKEEEYNLLDTEATSFLPYIIEKLGNSKDTIRIIANDILKLIAYIYPPKKQFTHLNVGLKSKCVQQRLECIDHLAWLISAFDINVAHQSLSQTIRKIANLLEDKDPSVRKATLNFFINCCPFEDLNKMVDYISEKSMRLLKKNLKLNPKLSMNGSSKGYNTQEMDKSCEENVSVIDSCDLKDTEKCMDEKGVEESHSDKVNLSRELDLKLPENPESLNFHTPKLKEIDLSFLTNLTPIKYIETAKLFQSASHTSIKLTETGEDLLNQIIKTSDSGISLVESLNPEEISWHKEEINSILDRITSDFIKLLGELKQISHPGVICYYNVLFAILKKLADNSNLCAQISEDNLIRLLEELLLLERDRKSGSHLDSFARSINGIVFSLLENSDKSLAICALLKILIVNTADVSDGFTELVARCFWKMDKDVTDWDSDLDLNKVLLLINTFLNTLPKSNLEVTTAKNNLKTVQHLLRKIVSKRGSEILQMVENWSPLTCNKEIIQLIKKYLNNLKIENNKMDKNLRLNSTEFLNLKELEPNLADENNEIYSKGGTMNFKRIELSSQTRELWMRLNSLKEKLGLRTENDEDERDVRLKEIYARTNVDSSHFTTIYIEEMKSRLTAIQSIINT